MGKFEVSITFNVEADDKDDAAAQAHALIDAATPRAYWVVNEGGVGEEVVVSARAGISSDRTDENARDLVEELYRLGITYGARTADSGSQAFGARVKEVKRAILSLAAQHVARVVATQAENGAAEEPS